jgi:hypothetical protein
MSAGSQSSTTEYMLACTFYNSLFKHDGLQFKSQIRLKQRLSTNGPRATCCPPEERVNAARGL